MRASHVYISTTSAKRSWFAPVSRARARARTRGQALIELMVALTALVVVTLGVSWLGRLLDMRQAHIAAARALAFECTVRPGACAQAATDPHLAGELRTRAFASERYGVRSTESLAGSVQPSEGRSLWVDRSGAPLLERFEDVTIAVSPERFNTPFAFVGSQGDRAFPGAVRVLSELGGPGRFGLNLEGGLVRAQVQTEVSRTARADGWISRLSGMPLMLRAHLVVLTDAWNASGPQGAAADSVQTRVEAGARVPLVEPALRAAWLPMRALLAAGGLLGFESSARQLEPYAIDMDIVPPDRLGAPVAPDPVSTDPGIPDTTGG